jgi:hypothetical protein
MAARTRPTELGGSFGPTASSPRSQENSASSSGEEVAIILVDMGQLIPIGTYGTRGEAEIVEGLLASAGIAASIRADDAGGAYPFVLSGGAQVLVDESDAEAASQVLAERTDEV